ncbi:phospholipid/cholesterol/gamma-HCH transport system substrate-binding protein [Mycolicibacterium sp. BK556]|uniref:MlaD family protein n=1 Tax=unclassified Mycolicibacterium TaxID=2636767 RepID=UPI0016175BA7|nr:MULTISPECIES: MlaD family protein [unclassified Mycolicibacterium]MBB3602676.1 phospholipid/cholesterol/gamma-HCH transport system substrate-binding protein [Mycolicibacterium sp. BK556]MBB3632428.1 phospholipid/cholesterol/gamma-HCH transport system substrate-binding protein [Mycolicibacterium sp. BK607]MBB3750461.1 phospholipid/cholesterol/gamma-HCH transport system substrate-binding protein [Mycolicibacterium sp. BK634]
MKFGARTTLAILVVMTLAGAAYMSFGVLDVGPTKQVNRLTLLLNSSGGLMPTSEVTMRGIKVGRVTGIQTTNTGLAVSMDVDRKYQVPADSTISVENLSAAGEQYIDFRPKVIAPPYFSDGAVIPADRVAPIVTASDLLTKANVLFTALNLDQIHGIIKDMSAAFSGNDETIDSLAVTAGLTAKVIRDDKELLTTLFSNVSTFTTNLGDLHAGEIISETGKILPKSVPAFLQLIHQIEILSHTGIGVIGPQDPAGILVAKFGEWLDMLAGPLGTFATILQPAMAPLHDIKIDAGHWLDFWESTFNDTGGVRVQLNVPQWHE